MVTPIILYKELVKLPETVYLIQQATIQMQTTLRPVVSESMSHGPLHYPKEIGPG